MSVVVQLDEAIAEALDSMGLAGKRRDDGWVIPAGGRLIREIILIPDGDGVRVRAVLVEWDELGPAEVEAVGRFLGHARGRLRFAHGDLEATRAVVTALVEGSKAAEELADAIGAVAAGCRLLAREAGALVHPEAARAYLEFHNGS
jgi:hypothetical protein